jgi:FkbM family methyltransferase
MSRRVRESHAPDFVRYQLPVLWGPARGTRLFAYNHDCLSAGFLFGTYERPQVRIMRTCLWPGATAYDVGANIGYLSLIMARLVGPRGRVFAFEPDLRSSALLRHNLAVNNARNVQVEPRAAAAESGTVPFASYEYGLVSAIQRPHEEADARILTVPAVSLDDFVYREGHPPPDLLKIDVERGEVTVLRGAMRLLQEHRPVLLLEVAGTASWQAVESLLAGSGYAARHLAGSLESQTDEPGVADFVFIPAAAPMLA